MKTIFFSAATSVSQIYGNAMRAVEMYIKSNLPSDYIKDSSISTQSSFRYFKKFINTKQEFEKKHRPFMIIRPTVENYSISEGNDFLSGTNIVWYSTGWSGGSGLAMQNFFKDPKYDLTMGFKISRCKMTFDIAIQTNTYMEMLDIKNYLSVLFTWDMPIYIPTSLESMIPFSVLKHLCEIVGINIDNKDNIPVLTRYLRTHSSYPISYKMQNSTSNDQYFLFYPQNIVTRMTGLTAEEPQRKNMVEEFANVTFRVECEFNAIASYLLYGKKNTYKKIKLCMHHDDGSFTPIYTYERIFGDSDFANEGFSLYSSNIIKSSPELDKKPESIDIRQCLHPELKKLVDEILSTGGDVGMLLKTRVIYNDRDATDDVDFTMNWSRYELTIKETDMTYTYRFLIYVNMAYYTDHTIDDILVTDQQNMNSATHTGYHNTHK